MKKLFNILLLIGSSVFMLNAQEYVVTEDNAIDSTIEKRGPNRKHYRHSYMNFGFSLDAGEAGAKVQRPRLDQFVFGVRYKRRIAEHFAIGYDINYTVNDYRLVQEEGKLLPDTLQNKRERMIFNIFEGGLYMRLNVGKRGNQLGKYIDLGAYGSATVAHTHFTVNKLSDGTTVRARRNGLDYFQRFNYGLNARLGINKLVLFGKYRLSDLFYADKNLPELPRIMAGLEFVLR
jgi:hypothetical protein